MKQAIILAGGKGTRLKERLGDLPKPLIDISGTPLLEHQIMLLKKYDFTDVIILVEYQAEKIISFCKKFKGLGINITCINDGKAMGTAGAILKIYDKLDSEFLVIYGDTMLNVNFDSFYEYHKMGNKAHVTLFVHPNDHPHDSDLVEIDDNGLIVGFHSYPHESFNFYPNLVNAGLYYFKKEALFNWKDNKLLLDFGKDLFPTMLNDKIKLRGYNSTEYIKDCGTPKRLDKVCLDFINLKIEKSSLENKQKVIFIDRDGTVNVEKGLISNVNQFDLLPQTIEAIKSINNSEYLVCLVTNQPVIARGDCTNAQLKQIHNKMETLLGKQGAYLDRIYFCPHHPDSGFEKEIKYLKIKCACRKPETGMIDNAVIDLNIDLTSSWFIGDSTVDMLTAKNAKIKSILVKTGLGGQDNRHKISPDFVFNNLSAAVDFILTNYGKLDF